MKRKKKNRSFKEMEARGEEILRQIREADAYYSKHKITLEEASKIDKANLIHARLGTRQNELIFDTVYFNEVDKIIKRFKGKETQKKKGEENYQTAKEILESLGEKLPIKGEALKRMVKGDKVISLWHNKRGKRTKVPRGDAWIKYQNRLLKERLENKV